MINNNKFFCISYLLPSKDDEETLIGVKIRGIFPTYREAKRHSMCLHKIDSYHHIFIGKIDEMLPLFLVNEEMEKYILQMSVNFFPYNR